MAVNPDPDMMTSAPGLMCSDDEDDPPTDDEVEEDLTVMGAQPYEHLALAEGLRQSPHTTLPRLATSSSVGTDSSEDKDTKPTAAEKKKRAPRGEEGREGGGGEEEE